MKEVIRHHAYSKKPYLLGLGFVLALTLVGCATTKKQIGPAEQKLIHHPTLNQQLEQEDFSFPSRPPRLSQGQGVFQQNCLVCHQGPMSYDKVKNVRPIDTYLMLTRGDQAHPTFRQLTRDQRWEALFYARYLAGGLDTQTKDVSALFGSNCAVCHGTKGFADGPLYTGHASAHELGMASVKNGFEPPPANFHSYSRMYNRTDEQLFKFIAEGVYPSAMPSWLGREDKAKGIVFDAKVIRDLVKYVRGFAVENDLASQAAPIKKASVAPKSSPSEKARV